METTHSITPLPWNGLRTAYRRVARPLSRSLSRFTRQRVAPLKPIWASAIDDVIASLETLNQSTESDFLTVGSKLSGIRSAAREISSELAALTELISGEQGQKTSSALAKILEHSKQLDERAAAGSSALSDVQEHSRRIPPAFSELRNRVLLFRTLCTLTRVETSRLGATGAGFEGLAEAVKPLSESIHLSGERVLAATAQLDASIQAALQLGSGLQSSQLAILHSLIDSVIGSLQSFEDRRRQAHDSSISCAKQNEAVCQVIDGLVQSLQSHDITRQQIEHVIQSLRQLRGEFGHVTSPDGLPPQARVALILQSSQLSSAASMFSSSVERMQHGLQDIVGRVRDMAETSQLLIGHASSEQSSFFVQMERCCTAILEAIAACHADSRQIHSLGDELSTTIEQLEESVTEIREIELQIQRIAINASIRAAHIRQAGAALNTIADTMGRLVCDSRRNTDDADEALASMRTGALRVSCGLDAAKVEAHGTDDALAQMRAAVLDLHSSSESSFSRVIQIVALGQNLGDEVSSVLAGFTAGQLVSGVVTRACGEIQRIAEETGTASMPTADAAPPNLETFAEHYSMQSERDIHQLVVAGAESLPVEPGNEAVPDGGGPGDLGDNVELF